MTHIEALIKKVKKSISGFLCKIFGHRYNKLGGWDFAGDVKYTVYCDFCPRCGDIKNYKIK